MAMIDTQTFALSKQRLVAALKVIPGNPDIFGISRMREARVVFLSGKNVLISIKGWLQSANIITNNGRQYLLSNYGKQLNLNDPKMEKASSWWSVHLGICFSQRCEPYRSLFRELGCASNYVGKDDKLISSLSGRIEEASGDTKSADTIKTNLEGVIKMFNGKSPLTDLRLVEFDGRGQQLKIGEPIVTDEIIIHAIALSRAAFFSGAITVNFRELVNNGVNDFLCLNVNNMRHRLRQISRSGRAQDYFSFAEGKDLDSIQFGSQLDPEKTLLNLLQESDDTWA